MQQIRARGYALREGGGGFEAKNFTIDSVADDHVVVEVAGCGVCHTDVSFFTGQVKTKTAPVILGHEISGTVIAAGSAFPDLVGKNVVIPAVLPCGECDLCRKGRDNICQSQLMPGNDFDGGFASHVVVPARFLCVLPEDLGDHELWQLSVIADAVTTPYQSLKRSGLSEGELAIVIGVGGIGTYMVQHARNAGATVLAIDVDPARLEAAGIAGASFTLDATGHTPRDIKNKVRSLVKDEALPANSWRVFEMSGTGAGQQTAFALLSYAGTVGIVGFTMDKAELRLSNVMAFDADLFGNWGCRPAYYPPCVEDVIAGRVDLRSNVEARPLDTIAEVFGLALDHQLDKRVVLRP